VVVVVVTSVVVVASEASETSFVVVTHVASKSTTFMYGQSNGRCDGSSSKNECNGEFDLNHF